MKIENTVNTETADATARRPIKQRRTRLLHSEWLIHINRCTEQNSRHEDYCAQHNLSIQSFKKHIWNERCKTPVALPKHNYFVPVTISDDTLTGDSGIEIRLAHGIILKIPHTTTLSTAVNVLQRQI